MSKRNGYIVSESGNNITRMCISMPMSARDKKTHEIKVGGEVKRVSDQMKRLFVHFSIVNQDLANEMVRRYEIAWNFIRLRRMAKTIVSAKIIDEFESCIEAPIRGGPYTIWIRVFCGVELNTISIVMSGPFFDPGNGLLPNLPIFKKAI